MIIAEGLIAHPKVTAFFNKDVISFGQIIRNKTKWNILRKKLIECDYFLIPDKLHFNIPHIIDFLNRNNLWAKSIIYDFKDSQNIEYDLLTSCGIYFKRSFVYQDRKPILNFSQKRIFPLNYCALEEYFLAEKPIHQREIDIGAYFSRNSVKWASKRRKNLLSTLLIHKWKRLRTHIAKPTTDNESGRSGIFDDKFQNSWYDYLVYLNNTKVIFSALPDNHDGDSRTWEALSSGALCLLDNNYIPMEKPLKNTIHAVFYDAKKPQEIQDSIAKAEALLKNSDQIQEIASMGLEWVRKYHMPINRIDYILRKAEKYWDDNPKKFVLNFQTKWALRFHFLKTNETSIFVINAFLKLVKISQLFLRNIAIFQKMESSLRYILKIS